MSEHDANARFLRESIVEPETIARARAHAVELGAAPISAVVGSQIAVLAAAGTARSIVEIGTGAGVSGLWLLRGAPTAVLTRSTTSPSTSPPPARRSRTRRCPPLVPGSSPVARSTCSPG
ncbi:hypothetical protein [Microbacterium sp. NRRL B-14842]|uniref:hypothetical protein n=1 Tax=Microbacterium sp. NRRL B-14842 TaxID=3162881 RepID=UPI003D2AE86B